MSRQTRIRASAAAGSSTSRPLNVVIDHLSSSESNGQPYSTVARGLHRASKGYLTAVRGSLRHLPLHRYYKGLHSAQSDSRHDTKPPDIPWEQLAAFPAVTAWTLAPQQLEDLTEDLVQQYATTLQQLKRLVVKDIDEYMAQQSEGMGLLLQACSHLEEVEVSRGEFAEAMPAAWELMDPDSTSWDTMKAPRFSLHSWSSEGLPFDLMASWLQQQPRGCPLTHVTVTGHDNNCSGRLARTWFVGDDDFTDPLVDLSPLAAVPGLQTLELDCAVTQNSLTALRALTHLTSLMLGGWSDAVAAAVCQLTGLRDLAVGSEEPLELPGSLSHLKQLTRLDIASCEDVSELPEDLGVWLPHLQQLEAEGCSLQAVPASLTALTTLYLTRGCADSLALPTTLSNLREVELRNSSYTSVTGLSSMLFLEYLDVANSSALCSSLAALQPLTRLRHLDLGGVEDLDPSSFTVLGALQALTYLGLAAPECKQTATACSRILAGAAPLAALVELDLGGHSAASLAALGPWLAGLTALTKLTMSECEVSSRGKMLHLPAGLRELGLRSCKLQQVPPGLKRLSALEVLNLSDNPKLCKLPTWLSQLGCLEALDLISTGVVSEQQVLAQMPTLRCVQIFQRHAKEVYGAAAHLHWGHSTRLEED